MSDLRAAILRQHWIEVQRHIYQHGHHSIAQDFYGWSAFFWKYHTRGYGLLVPRLQPAPVKQAMDFLQGIAPSVSKWSIETCSVVDAELEAQLRESGTWQPVLELPGHFIPTDAEWCDALRRAFFMEFQMKGLTGAIRDDYHVRFVDSEERLRAYARVQGLAYRETYDLPTDCMRLLYPDLSALAGPDVLAAVGYLGQKAVRTACIIRKCGVVGGVGGAALPHIRGKHLGEPLIAALATEARELWGADVVHHITMPAAVPIAKRLKLEQVTTYTRWEAR